MKKRIVCLVLGLFLLGAGLVSTPSEAKGLSLLVDGKPATSVAPFVHQNSLYLPVRDLGRLFGAKVFYEKSSEGGKITLERNENVVKLYFESPYLISGTKVLLAKQKPLVLKGKSYLPLRTVSEAFGVPVHYEASKKEVSLYLTKQDFDKVVGLDFSFGELMRTGAIQKQSDLTLSYRETPKATIEKVGSLALKSETNQLISYFDFLKRHEPECFYKESKAFIADSVNFAREESGYLPLTYSMALEKGADIRAKEISKVFSHTRPNQKAPWTVLEGILPFYEDYGYGENIAVGYKNPIEVYNGWMTSKGHRANILNPSLESIGVSYQMGYSDTLKLSYPREHWAQLFATDIV